MAPDTTDTETHRVTRREEAVDIPLERIEPETLRRMLEEFVTRD